MIINVLLVKKVFKNYNELFIICRDILNKPKHPLNNFGSNIFILNSIIFRRRVLMQSDSISEFGGIQWELLGIMFVTWIVVYFALWKGITQARKVCLNIIVYCIFFSLFIFVLYFHTFY